VYVTLFTVTSVNITVQQLSVLSAHIQIRVCFRAHIMHFLHTA